MLRHLSYWSWFPSVQNFWFMTLHWSYASLYFSFMPSLFRLEGMPREWGAKEQSWRSAVKVQSWGSVDARAINTYWFRIPLLLKESRKLHQPELGRTNGSALPRRDWGSWGWCGLKAWNKGNSSMKKLTLPQFIFSQLNIIGNYACSPWIFTLILATN